LRNSHTSHAHGLSQLLEDDQLEAGGWSESSPDWEESLVETEWSFVLQDLGEAVSEATVEWGLDWLVHQSGSDDVEWGNSAGHEETGSESRGELEWDSVGHTQFSFAKLLAGIIAGHFSGVQDHGSHDVGLDTLVESTNTLSGMDLLGVVGESFLFTGVGHHSCLQDIEWVTSEGTDGTSQSTSNELLEESSTWLVGTDNTLDWLVESESEGSVRGLSHPGSTDTLVEG